MRVHAFEIPHIGSANDSIAGHTLEIRSLEGSPNLRDGDLVVVPAMPGNDPSANELLTKRVLTRASRGGLTCVFYINDLGSEHHVGMRLAEVWGLVPQTDPRSLDNVLSKEFASYLSEFGKAGLVFKGEFEQQQVFKIASSAQDDDALSAFAVRYGNGLIYIVPANFVGGSQVELIGALATAIEAHSKGVLVPTSAPIVDSFSFSLETNLRSERDVKRSELETLDTGIEKYNSKKDVLFLRDDPLADRLPVWIHEQLGIETKRHEQYLEDFWICDDAEKEIVICEAKAVNQNVQRKHISALCLHRDERELDEDFPALLVMNTYADAQTLKIKDGQRVSPRECAYAAKRDVLILRTLDLVRLLDRLERDLITRDQIIELFTTRTGWLKVTGDTHEVLIK